ncbi:MAG TPA: 5-(carboxyamino)imidazole ribonucleotide synthase [Gammaproteobacteria bacterium]|nr:5-(carboxyamino)imidazole ribonucleotide synthase [Gammaproteobacteria bacterium]
MKTVGIIGAGQLGRMLALAGYPLGLRFIFLDHSPDAPGGQVGDIITGAFDDPAKLAALAARADVLTFDVENVPVAPLEPIVANTPLRPGLNALATAQDRLLEKRLFQAQGLATPAFAAVDSLEGLRTAVAEIGLPAVLKTRRLGYDGKGQHVLHEPADVEIAWQRLGGVPLILEGFVAFEREVSIIGVRGLNGECRFYPLAHNMHHNGILHYSRAPYDHAALQSEAERHARTLMEHFDYAGVLTIEFFVKDGALIANEIAPRVHNSGHWTIEGAETSQFENHVRAILGLPLGSTAAVGHSAMINFLGTIPPLDDVLPIAGAHYHDYGKAPRPGRKLGHCTLRAATAAEIEARLPALLALATPAL